MSISLPVSQKVINFLITFSHCALFIDPGAWSNGAASIGISLMVATFDSALFLGAIWTHFVELHVAGTCILDHPAYDPRGAHFIIYDPALIDVSTAAYVDVIKILDSIQQLHVDGIKNEFKVVFVVGDQQTYDRMCALIILHPDRFRWCIPMNGDFHFVAHVVAAVHNLYFLPFTAWIVEKIGFDKVIKLNDDNVTNFTHYDHFYLLLTLAIMTLLSDVLDPTLLSFPSVLLEKVKNNKSICFCLKVFRFY